MHSSKQSFLNVSQHWLTISQMDNNVYKNQTLYFWLFLVNIIDLIGSFIAFALCGFSLWLCMNRQMFHKNLMFLILNFHMHGFFLTGGGFVKCAMGFVDFSILGSFLM